MATQVQFRRGTTTQNNAFTGAIGEITYDSEVKTLRLHDGTTAGGAVVTTTTSTQTLTNKTISTGSTWQGNAVGLAYGGAGASLTAAAGGVLYSTASALVISPTGVSGQVLTSGGTSAPVWVNQSAIQVGVATTSTNTENLNGGSPGYIPYQIDANETGFIAPGASGTFLRSTGASTVPDWAAGQVTYGSTTVAFGETSTSISGLTAINATSGATAFFATPTSPVAFAGATTLTIGYGSTASSTTNISTGAVGSGNTKTINIGTGGASGSTTNINLGDGDGGTVTVNKDLVVTGDLTVNGTTTTINSTTLDVDDINITVAKGAADSAAADGAGLTVDGASATLLYTHATQSWNVNKPLIGGTTDYWKVPAGTVLQRPASPVAGMIRYNSDQTVFEGYSSGAWSSLGGVKSVDAYTYIQAETSAGAGNGDLDFYAENSGGDGATQVGQWNRTNLKDYTGTLVGTQTTQNVFNATATTVNAFGASTATTVGATTGTHTIRNATVSLPNATAITTGQTTVALLNTTATTVNAFGAASALNLGASTGTLTVANPTLSAKAITASTTLTVTGATVLNGGLTMDTDKFTVADTTGNTSIGGTLAVTGNTTLSGTLAVTGNQTNTGDLAVNGGDLTTTATTFNLLNTTATTLNIGGAATTMTIGSGATGATTTMAKNVVIVGNLTVQGTTTTEASSALTVSDSAVYLNDGATDNTKDIGLVGTYVSSGTKYTGFVKDASDGVWKLFSAPTNAPTAGTTVDFTGATYDSIKLTAVNKVTITEPASSATLTISNGGSLITSGGHSLTLTTSATTNVTLPTTGTLATLSGTETLANKTLTTPNIGAATGTSLTTTGGGLLARAAATQDGIEIRGRAGGTGNWEVIFTPATLSADRTLTAPDVSGTIVTTGDTGSVTNTMLAGSIANAKLANSTISGIALGSNLATLTIGTGLSGTSYNGSTGITIANTGVTSIVAGTGISISGATGAVTVTNTITNTNQLTNGAGYITAVPNASTQVSSLGVGTAASGTTGEIRATNQITSYYSDDRLKTRTGNIQNALEKVLSLDGFHYYANETAVALGYDASKQEVGLSAQQVQAVLPEVIAPAPIDPQYMTLNYDRLVPLLVEAIKEQQKQIEELKAKLGN